MNTYKDSHLQCTRKVWIEDICMLVDSTEIIPKKSMPRNEKINTLTRLVILLFITMLLFRYKYSLVFLGLAFVIILFIYFINTKERYSPMQSRYKNPLIAQNTLSNQKLSQPVIPPRSHDIEVWGSSSSRSGINTKSNYDFSDEFMEVPMTEEFDPRVSQYTDFTFIGDNSTSNNNPEESTHISQVLQGEEITTPISQVFQSTETTTENSKDTTPISQVLQGQEKFESNTPSLPQPNTSLLIPKTEESIYLPSEYPPERKYLSSIGPDEYTYSDFVYPTNANLGISYTPSNIPRVVSKVATNDGAKSLYYRMNPENLTDEQKSASNVRKTNWTAKYAIGQPTEGYVDLSEIYDPRYNGYGDGYRSYADMSLGQVQYYYNDVDKYKRQDYSSRNKVDFMEYTDPMGKVYPDYKSQIGLNDIKESVHNQYDRDALQFRNDLQESLMSKRNREIFQMRHMPLRSN